MTRQRPRLGIALMVLATLVFAIQDGFSRHLAVEYNVLMVVAVRYWFFAAFVLALARRRGGIAAVARTGQPVLQAGRGVLLAAEICVMVAAFTLLGLVESLAVFASVPLLVVALSAPVLGERVGPWRAFAVAVGFAGVLLILRPGRDAFSPQALVPVCSAVMFAVYALLTRYAARKDSAETSLFWTGAAGAAFMTPLGLLAWEPMSPSDWGWMGALCVSGVLGHWLLIRVYEVAEASAVQPFAYLHFVFGAAMGFAVFGETLRANVLLGAATVVAAGLFALWRERRAGVSA